MFDEEKRKSYPCKCRPARLARKRAAAVAGRIPKAYRGVSFDREPLPSIERAHPHVVREVRRYCGSIAEQLDEGRGLWFTGPPGTGKTTLAMLISKPRDGGRPHVRDLLAAAPAGDAARDVPGRLPAQPEPARGHAVLGRPAAHRRRRRRADQPVGARAALHGRQHALRGPARGRRHHEPDRHARDVRRRRRARAPRSATARCRACTRCAATRSRCSAPTGASRSSSTCPSRCRRPRTPNPFYDGDMDEDRPRYGWAP